MEVRLSRGEIRRLMRATMGQAETEATSGQNAGQMNALIDMAALEMHNDGPWPVAEVRSTVDLGPEQYKFAYPADCDLGSIREIAMSDGGIEDSVYVTLLQRPLPVWLDVDQQEAAGGATFDAVQGTPYYWNQRGGYVFVWPVNDDTPRKLRLAYQPRKTFATDASISLVDGQAILYKSLALYYGTIEDAYNADRWEKMYMKRTATLRAWQSSNYAANLDDSANMDDFRDPLRPVPQWDTRTRTV